MTAAKMIAVNVLVLNVCQLNAMPGIKFSYLPVEHTSFEVVCFGSLGSLSYLATLSSINFQLSSSSDDSPADRSIFK